MNPVYNQPVLLDPPMIIDPLHVALHKVLEEQIAVFKKAFNDYDAPLHDQLTKNLIIWTKDFEDDLKKNVPETTQNEFIARLHRLLEDPIAFVPLEEESFLGNDGCTYTKNSLLLYLANAHGIYRYRSPIYPERAEHFYVVPHPIVPIMVQWLKQKGDFQPDLDMEEAVQNLIIEERAPEIPTLEILESRKVDYTNERIHLIKERLIQEQLMDEKEERLIQSLDEFRMFLENCPLTDPLTIALTDWQQQFALALDMADDIEEIQSEFIASLQKLLKDPFTNEILDGEPLLGSDEVTYSKNMLMIVLDGIPEIDRAVSPKKPNEALEFTVSPHPVAARMIQWLKELGAYKPYPEREQEYQRLLKRGNPPILPTKENIQARRLLEEYAAQLRDTEEPFPGTLRREIGGQILLFKTALDNYKVPMPALSVADMAPEEDRLTKDLRIWIGDFQKCFTNNKSDPEGMLVEYIGRLQRILIDSKRDIPLEEEAYLGSDGATYNKKALLVYRETTQGAAQFRSPLYPDRAGDFYVELHPIAPMMVKWMREKEALHPCPILEMEYQNLISQGKELIVPTKANEEVRLTNVRIQQMRERLLQEGLMIEKEEALEDLLMEFGNLLEESPLTDPLTERLREWQKLFNEAVQISEDIDETQQIFIELLQEHLKDDFSMSTLDEEPLLGSDDMIYSSSLLTLIIKARPEVYFNRSPRFPDRPKRFSVAPHPVAARMVQWLKEMGAYHPSVEIQNLYQELLDSGNIPLLPTEENLLAAQLQEQFAANQRQNAADIEAFEEQQRLLRLQDYVVAAFEGLRQENDNDRVEIDADIGIAEQRNDERVQQINARIDQVQQEQDEFLQRAGALQGHIDYVGARIVQVQGRNAELQASLDRTHAALKEREKGWLKSLITTIAIIGACALATAILGPAGLGMVTPVQQGAMYKFTIPLGAGGLANK